MKHVALTYGAAFFCCLAAVDSNARMRDDVPDEQFVEWARQAAVPFERWTVNAELDAYLESALHDHRIMFLGEPGHFFQEKYDVQLMLIEALVQRGYRHLFIEGLGASAAAIVNDFVVGELQPIPPGENAEAAQRYRDRVLGLNVPEDSPEFQRRLAGAQHEFFTALRAISAEQTEPLTIHPLDVDMAAGGCRLDIDALLAKYEDHAKLGALRARCAREADEVVGTWFARLEQIRDEIDASPDVVLEGLGEHDRDHFLQHLDCLVESLAFTLTRQADGVMDRALVRREPAMFRQVKAALDRLPSDAKVIMMGHCNHLSRVGGDTMRARQPSLGEMIVEAHPDDVFSIWMLHDHGSLLNPMGTELVEELRSDPQRIESLLRQAGSTFVLPLHSGAAAETYLDQKRRISYFSWYEEVTLSKQVDALLFLDEITALPDSPVPDDS